MFVGVGDPARTVDAKANAPVEREVGGLICCVACWFCFSCSVFVASSNVQAAFVRGHIISDTMPELFSGDVVYDLEEQMHMCM